MGRRRPTSPPAAVAPEPTTGFAARQSPVGGARVPWSYLAALLAALVTGLGFAIADAVQSTTCADDDPFCALGVYVVGGLAAGVLGTVLVAWLFRLGWEWCLLCVAVVVAMPTLLDLVGTWSWVILALTPGLAALATLGGVRRPRWRPGVIAGASTIALAVTVIWTFFPPGA